MQKLKPGIAISWFGERTKDIAHILEGVKPGDVVVTSGQIRLSNHAKVTIVEDSALTPPAETPML